MRKPSEGVAGRRAAWVLGLALTALLARPPAVGAAGGDLDPSFGAGGKVNTDFSGGWEIAYDVAVQTDGKIIVAGVRSSTEFYTSLDMTLARHESDGSLDGSFGSGGKVVGPLGSIDDGAVAVVVQPDGTIVIAGWAGPDFAVARYESDGDLDPTFGAGGVVITDVGGGYDRVMDTVLRPDGYLIVAGRYHLFDNSPCAVVRYEPDGDLDPSFGGVVVVPDLEDCGALALQVDGRIVVGGEDALGNFALVRLNADGTPDGTFGTGGTVTTWAGFAGTVTGLLVQPDGKLVAAGGQDRFWVQTADLTALARYGADGTLDASFGTGGIVTGPVTVFDGARARLALQPDSKLLMIATPAFGESVVLRYDTDGSLDPGFSSCIVAYTGTLMTALARQSDGKIVTAGTLSKPPVYGGNLDFAVARFGVPGDPPACEPAAAAGSRLKVKEVTVPGQSRKLTWKWRSTGAVGKSDFGTPPTGTDETLCLLGGGAPVPLALLAAPGASTCTDEPCWSENATGFKYKLSAANFGRVNLKLQAGQPGKIVSRARGNLGSRPFPLPLPTPVTVRLKRGDGVECWEANFSAAKVNDAGRFVATSD